MDIADAGNLAEILGEAREVAEVEGLDDEVDIDGLVVSGARFYGLDVGAVLGDDGGELLEQAGAVVDEDDQLDGVGGRLGRVG